MTHRIQSTNRGFAKGWFPKGFVLADVPRYKNWNEGTFGCSPRYQNRNKSTFGCSPVPKNRNEGTFAKTALLRNRPFFRKILVSERIIARILGPELAAPILWVPGSVFFLQENLHAHKIPRFRGGYLGFFQQKRVYPYPLGAGSARPIQKRVLQTQKTLYF